MKFIKVKLNGGKMPTMGTSGSAAWDLYSPVDIDLYPGSRYTLDLKISVDLGRCGAILSHRSGHNSKYGIQAYGLIDPDYRGPLKVTLFNTGEKVFRIEEGDRIAQLRLVEVPSSVLHEVDELEETERGERGHGSTGD